MTCMYVYSVLHWQVGREAGMCVNVNVIAWQVSSDDDRLDDDDDDDA